MDTSFTDSSLTSPQVVIRQINKLHEQEELVDARNLINDALEQWPNNRLLNILKGESLLESGKSEEAIVLFKSIVSEDPKAIRAHMNLIAHYFNINDRNAGFASGENAVTHIPDHVPLLLLLMRNYYKFGRHNQVEKIWKLLEPLVRDTPDGKKSNKELYLFDKFYPGIKYRRASKLILNHEFDKARSVYEEIIKIFGSESRGDCDLNIMNKLQSKASDQDVDSLVKHRSESEYKYFRREDSDSALLIFSANTYEACGIPVNFLQVMIEPYNLNVIYLHDSLRLLGLNGISSLGNNLDATIQEITKTLDSWNIKNIYCMGSSGSGYTAALYGIKLKANSINVFSGPASLKKEFIEKDGRARNFGRKLLKNVPDNCHDLPSLINECESPPHINFYFGGNQSQDRVHAEHLSQSKNVTIYEVKECDEHRILPTIVDRDNFDQIMSRLICHKENT